MFKKNILNIPVILFLVLITLQLFTIEIVTIMHEIYIQRENPDEENFWHLLLMCTKCYNYMPIIKKWVLNEYFFFL